MTGIRQSELRRLLVPIAPVETQRRIVEIIEDHLAHLDAADASLTLASRRLPRLLGTGLWQATHGLQGAREARLDDIAEVRLGRQRSPKNHTGDRMRPYLRAANVDWDRLRLDDVLEMNFTAAEESTYLLKAGDILLTEASGSPAEVGKSAVYEGNPANVCFQNTLLRVRAHGANPAFLQKYLLAEAHAGRFVPEARGVGISHLGRAKLARLLIQLPPLENQQDAVEQCRSLTEQLTRLRDEQKRAAGRSTALRRAVLAAAFSGRLTGRSTDAEVIEGVAEG